MSATKVWLNGYTGRMGQQIAELLNQDPETWQLCGGLAVDNVFDKDGNSLDITPENITKTLTDIDCIIDFSLPAGSEALCAVLKSQNIQNKSVLVATTGLGRDIVNQWAALAKSNKLKVLVAPNTSIGITVLVEHAMKLATVLMNNDFDVEMVETHHRYKKDAPSGTALYIQNSVNNALSQAGLPINEKPVHALRAGGVYGEHSVRFISDDEEIEISHRALSRKLFAKGALNLTKWLKSQESGFYHLSDVKLV